MEKIVKSFFIGFGAAAVIAAGLFFGLGVDLPGSVSTILLVGSMVGTYFILDNNEK